MDNMGSLQKLYYIDSADFVSLVEGENNLSTLTLQAGVTIEEIEFTQETGKISESQEETDHGLLYNFEVSCTIPKCGPDNINPFGDLRQKKILILGEDSNENLWLAGAPGSYFSITSSGTSGQVAADLNSRQLKIIAALMNSSVFILSPF